MGHLHLASVIKAGGGLRGGRRGSRKATANSTTDDDENDKRSSESNLLGFDQWRMANRGRSSATTHHVNLNKTRTT